MICIGIRSKEKLRKRLQYTISGMGVLSLLSAVGILVLRFYDNAPENNQAELVSGMLVGFIILSVFSIFRAKCMLQDDQKFDEYYIRVTDERNVSIAKKSYAITYYVNFFSLALLLTLVALLDLERTFGYLELLYIFFILNGILPFALYGILQKIE